MTPVTPGEDGTMTGRRVKVHFPSVTSWERSATKLGAPSMIP